MDFRSVKNLMIGGKSVSKLLVGGRLVWKKAEPAPPEPVVDGAYIETDGVSSYMDLGIVPDVSTSYEIDVMYEGGKYTGTSTLRNCAYGCATGAGATSAWHVLYFRGTDGFIKFAKPTSNLFTEFVPGVRFKVSVSAAVDGKSSISVGDHAETVTNTYTAATTMKFGCSYTESPDFYATARFYSAKFWQNGALVRDLVPYSGPRGVGLLDKVHDVLYTNAGGGTLTYGEEGGAWTNPYITDGLLGMWDAEWNEAGGVHNPDLMQLNDLTGNLFPMPVAVLGDNWASRSENPTFKASDYPMLNELIGLDSCKRYSFEGYSSFDPYIGSSSVRYAFNSVLLCKNESGTNTTDQMGYGLNSSGYCMNMRGFLAMIASTVPGADGVGRTFSCSSYKMPGDKSVAYLDGEKYGEYLWTSSTLYKDVVSFSFGNTGNYWDKIRTSCVRIYNRVLTPEEVAHNARVDRERFGA